MSTGKSKLSSTFKQYSETPTQLGELLMRAGMISQKDLDDVFAVGQQVPGRLGQLLVMAGLITQNELQDALQVQCLMREHILDRASAVQALRMTRGQRIPLETAIDSLQPKATEAIPSNRLGDLLVDAGILDRAVLEDALSKNAATGLPLGRILVLSREISDELLIAALNAQVVLRRGGIDREDALRTIASAHEMYQERRANTTAPRGLPAGKLSPDRAPQVDKAPKRPTFVDFLVLCKTVAQGDREHLEAVVNKGELISILSERFGLGDPIIEVADLLFDLVQQKKLGLDEAVFAFEYLSYEVTSGCKRLYDAAEKLAFHNGIWAPYEAVTAA